MFLNKQNRIKYLGFDDKWFCIIGIFIISMVTNFLFNDSWGQETFFYSLISWSISLFFTICNWFFMRFAVIYLRKKLPAFEDSIKRIVILFVTLIISVLIINYMGNHFLARIIGNDFHPALISRIVIPVILISIMIQAIYEAIFYYVRLQKAVRIEEQSKQAIVQAQLDALRNQAQPHFFFNTLNTLRDIIDQNTKEEAKDFVDKLSNVYRFILDSGNANIILVEDELKFTKSYIHIQKERFGDNLIVNWNIPELTKYNLIVPMSLQLLLENTIKHNVVSRSSPLVVDISVADNHLIVTNKIKLKSTALPSTKLGLSNIKKRYELITDQAVSIINNGDEFIVTLPLLTNTHKTN